MIELVETSTVTTAHGVSIVIPAYNEENGIALVLEQITKILRTAGLAHEVIVVDDGSTDRTSEILEKRDDIRLLRHAQNQGYDGCPEDEHPTRQVRSISASRMPMAPIPMRLYRKCCNVPSVQFLTP
jgi:cellulose synthase/poly-beta-1,6-N-acetylglucosamine synthase-like glycosyltransferase